MSRGTLQIFLRFSLLLVAAQIGYAQTTGAQLRWYRGNTHTHTSNSDGDSPPRTVAGWYRDHGYDFLFITDHGMVTDVAPLNAQLGADGRFLVLPGEEITANRRTPRLAVHVNALGLDESLNVQIRDDARATLQANLDLVAPTGALAQVNHPNFHWQLPAETIAATQGAQLIEIANMHPQVNTFGAGPSRPGAEATWDELLSRGAKVWGVASDDMHQLEMGSSSVTGTAGEGALPGRGWVMVHASALTPQAILGALKEGAFYSSTGVTLSDHVVTDKEIRLAIKAETAFQTEYRVQFIGAGGKVLQNTVGAAATYRVTGEEPYVRAVVTDSNGLRAWTQPVFIRNPTRTDGATTAQRQR
jgi:hypothetical protein